jgi:predicted RNase H-like nuclease (RuvC/YqgF family)
MADETLVEEHARLLRETEELRKDHAALESDHSDMSGHRRHRIRLQKQIDALHDHINRIKREAADDRFTDK